eukprot:gene5094-5598_t
MAAGLYGANKDEFLVSLAALALYDGEAEITSDNIATLIKESGNSVAPYWPGLFSGLLKNRIEQLVFAVGAAPSAAAAGAAPAAAAAGGAEAGEAKKEEKPKVEEVDALDGGMDMFGGGGAGGGDY